MSDEYINLELAKYFGPRIKARRENLSLTQAELAIKVGVSKTTIQNYESGTIPKGASLFKLSRALKCSIDWLLAGEESPYIREGYILEYPSCMTEEELAEYHSRGEPYIIKTDEIEGVQKNEKEPEYKKDSNNLIELQHRELVKEFSDKIRAKSANIDLIKIEKLDRNTFIEVVGYIKGVANGLSIAVGQSKYTGEERRSGDRRNNDGTGTGPGGKDRRDGTDRRKTGT